VVCWVYLSLVPLIFSSPAGDGLSIGNIGEPTAHHFGGSSHYQRQGLGQALLALLMVASERGLERATLEVKLLTSQPCLCIKIWLQNSWAAVALLQDTGEDALILWRGVFTNLFPKL